VALSQSCLRCLVGLALSRRGRVGAIAFRSSGFLLTFELLACDVILASWRLEDPMTPETNAIAAETMTLTQSTRTSLW